MSGRDHADSLRVIVRRAGVGDVAALARLQDVESGMPTAFADWVGARAESHLPFVAEIDGHVVGAVWLLVAERVSRNDSLDRRYGDRAIDVALPKAS